MIWRIKAFFTGISNLIKWFPVIWKDRNWDYTFIYRIFLAKIKHVREYTQKIDFYAGNENDIKWMLLCEKLLTLLIEDNFCLINYKNKYVSDNNIGPGYLSLKNRDPKRYAKVKKCMLPEIYEDKMNSLLWKIISCKIKYWWD
jgi:hypothetical protein